MDLRKIDTLMAEYVMGLKKKRIKEVYSMFEYHCDIREYDAWVNEAGEKVWNTSYSTDISAAYTVLEKLKLSIVPHGTGWRAGILWLEDDYEGGWDWSHDIISESLPLAICLAALKVKGVDEYEK